MTHSRPGIRCLFLVATLALAGSAIAQPRDRPGRPDQNDHPEQRGPDGRDQPRRPDVQRAPAAPREPDRQQAPPSQPGPGWKEEKRRPPRENDARYHELEARRQGGRLNEGDKPEWNHLSERQKRYDEMRAHEQQQERDRAERRRVSQLRLVVTFNATRQDPRAVEEWQSHARRSAQLARARAVAVAEGREDARLRADELNRREDSRHSSWVAAHSQGNR
jgi:hypothetical protein